MLAGEYIETTLKKVKERNGNEAEFIQAIEEIYQSLEPVLAQREDLIEANILERLAEPERMIMFKVPWQDDRSSTRDSIFLTSAYYLKLLNYCHLMSYQ